MYNQFTVLTNPRTSVLSLVNLRHIIDFVIFRTWRGGNDLTNSILDFKCAFELLLWVCIRPGDLLDRPWPPGAPLHKVSVSVPNPGLWGTFLVKGAQDVDKDLADSTIFGVLYDDGDREDLTAAELAPQLLPPTSDDNPVVSDCAPCIVGVAAKQGRSRHGRTEYCAEVNRFENPPNRRLKNIKIPFSKSISSIIINKRPYKVRNY